MQKLFVSLLLVLLMACNNSTTNAEGNDPATEGSVHAGAADTIVTSAQPLVLTGCYEMTMKKDSAFLDLQVADTIVTGTLEFDFFEKDRNKGTLQGVLRNDHIFADYTFQSEGVTSVREIIFKIKDSILVQAYGELKEEGSRLVFADKEALQYEETHPFIKVACPTR